MLVQDLLRDGQAEARAARLARTGLVHAVEAVEQARQVLFGDADAVVRDADEDVWAARADLQVDPAAVGRVFDGVANDVHHHLFQAAAVAHDQRQAVQRSAGKLVLVAFGLQGIGSEDTLNGLPKGETGES